MVLFDGVVGFPHPFIVCEIDISSVPGSGSDRVTSLSVPGAVATGLTSLSVPGAVATGLENSVESEITQWKKRWV